MLTFLADKFRFLLVLVLIIIGVSFIFFGSWTPSGARMGGPLGTVEGRKIKRDDFLASTRATQIAHALHTGTMVNRFSDESSFRQAWTRLIILAAAREAGIRISDKEVLDAIRQNQLFQENGKYSPTALQRFFKYFLTPQGITPERFQKIVHEELAIERMLNQIGGTAVVQPGEAEKMFGKLFGPSTVSVVRLSLDQARRSVKPAEKELKAFYEKNTAKYMTPERRKIEWVEFQLSAKQQKLSEAERAEALAKLGEQAFDFTGIFLNAAEAEKVDFKAEAEKAGFKVQTKNNVQLDKPFLERLKRPDLVQLAFDLIPEAPVSDYIPTENGFVVLHLVEALPQSPVSFEQARKQVRKDYIDQKAGEVLRAEAAEFRKAAEAKLAEGVSWEKAARSLKQKARTLPPFVVAEPSKDKIEDGAIIRFLAQRLEPGQLSHFESTEKGGLFVYLKKRAAPDEKKREEMLPKIQASLLQQRREQITEEWLLSRFSRPKTRLPVDVLGKTE